MPAALCEADGTPIPGYTLADSEQLNRDATGSIVPWKKGAAPLDRPVVVVIAMTNARLFSLQAGTR